VQGKGHVVAVLVQGRQLHLVLFALRALLRVESVHLLDKLPLLPIPRFHVVFHLRAKVSHLLCPKRSARLLDPAASSFIRRRGRCGVEATRRRPSASVTTPNAVAHLGFAAARHSFSCSAPLCVDGGGLATNNVLMAAEEIAHSIAVLSILREARQSVRAVWHVHVNG
jgi:hypothetical protein